MGRRLRKRQLEAQPSRDDDKDELIEEKARSRLSLKDAGIILTMSSVLSVSLVIGTIGVSGVVERFHRNDLMDFTLAIVFCMCLFAFLSYILVKVAAHYVVYLAVATFCGIIFPVSPHRQQRTTKEIYEKVKSR